MTDRLIPGQRLELGQMLTSHDGRVRLEMQRDGNLVLYVHTHALWATGTNNGFRVFMQTDGNFVLYRPDNTPAWASNTNGQNVSELVVQNDGNLVMYSPTGAVVWATNTQALGE